jgi:hypothetical protein
MHLRLILCIHITLYTYINKEQIPQLITRYSLSLTSCRTLFQFQLISISRLYLLFLLLLFSLTYEIKFMFHSSVVSMRSVLLNVGYQFSYHSSHHACIFQFITFNFNPFILKCLLFPIQIQSISFKANQKPCHAMQMQLNASL